MAIAAMPGSSLRLERAESSRLAWAFVISVALHLLVVGTFESGRKFGWWDRLHWPDWLKTAKILPDLIKKKESPQPPEQREAPLLFVDVGQPTTEPPKNAKYYSDKNSVAGNPDSSLDSSIPRIDGKQTQVLRTEDVPRSKAFPLQPDQPPPAPNAEVARDQQKELKARPAQPPGDLALAKPETTPRKDQGEAPRPRPATIQEAKARLEQKNRLAGEKTKQEGGVKRRVVNSSVDAVATPFGRYDAALIAAVQNRWYSLLDSRDYAGEGIGKVTLKFHLNSDGTISEINFVESTVDSVLGWLCVSAIKDPAPYGPWPADLKREARTDHRELCFTFFYN